MKPTHQNPVDEAKLLDVPRLAEYLSVPIGTIRDWCYKRSIPFVKVGRHVRFRPKEIESWLQNNRVDTYRPLR